MIRWSEDEFKDFRARLQNRWGQPGGDAKAPKRTTYTGGRNVWTRADGSPSENGEARALCEWMKREGVRFVRIPNEGSLAAISRGGGGGMLNVLKLTGLQPNAPDYLVLEHPTIRALDAVDDDPRSYPRVLRGHYCGVAIELKPTPQGQPPKWPEVKDGQRAFLRMFEELGWIGFVAFGAAQAIERLTELGIGKSAKNRRGS